MRQKQPLLTHLFMSFSDAFRGLKYTWHEERNFRIGICISLLIIIALVTFDFSYTDVVFAVLTMMLVLGAEVINTAFEDTLNKIEPNFDHNRQGKRHCCRHRGAKCPGRSRNCHHRRYPSFSL